MDRREFCWSSAAAAISGAAAGLVALQAAGQMTAAIAPIFPFYKIIYDHRYPASRAFGAAAEGVRTAERTRIAERTRTVGDTRSTADIVAIDGDITALWSRDLRARWSAGDGAIAGMTTVRSLFCLEQLAKDHWMRVVIRAEHALRTHEGVHRVTAPAPAMARIKSALMAEHWPSGMPTALTACQGADGAPRVACVIESKGYQGWAATDDTLVSFVIA